MSWNSVQMFPPMVCSVLRILGFVNILGIAMSAGHSHLSYRVPQTETYRAHHPPTPNTLTHQTGNRAGSKGPRRESEQLS